MGNKESNVHDDFNKMIKQKRRDEYQRLNINPQKKYLAVMKDALVGSKLPQTLKQLIRQTLQIKVSVVELIQTVTCINALKKNQFQNHSNRSPSILKERPQSKFVRVRFDQGFLQKILRQFRQSHHLDPSSQDTSSPLSPVKSNKSPASKIKSSEQIQGEQTDRKEKIRGIGLVMKKELNRIMHPFGKLNKAFAEYIEGNSQQFAPKKCSEEVYERSVIRLVNEWCSYLQNSCLQPYKKWIMNYTELQERKYVSWVRNLLLQQIWSVNNGYLFSMLTTVIHRCKIPLHIDFKELQECAALLTPSLFNIDKKLQIQGHFFDSIYQMSEVVSKIKPEQILTQLQTVKKRVCTDIDNYHRLIQLGQVYEIDSDNILGIVAYILCKIQSKIDQIHTHLIFLRIIYGEKVYFSMGLGSYMLSTIFGAIQFLQSPQFKELILQKRQRVPQGKTIGQNGKSETKVSSAMEGSLEECSQGDHKEIHTNSLLSHL